jgi:N-acetylgalactosamine kinase
MEYLPLPENLKVVCANSLVEAKKSSRAKGLFNQRIACYEIGFRLIKKNFPEFRERLKHLRDVNPANLGTQEMIYQALKSLPESASREDIVRLLPEENLDVFFETHAGLDEEYRLRDVTAYGVCECARGEQCADFLKQGEFEEFGKLMFISHDGDRVISHGPDGNSVAWDYRVTDAYLSALLAKLAAADPRTRARAQVCYQPGAYRCSTPELDLIVDLSRRVPGILGAKLTGAGLGGCVVILVREEAADRVLENLSVNYYRPKGLPDSAFVCRSAEGAEILEGP